MHGIHSVAMIDVSPTSTACYVVHDKTVRRRAPATVQTTQTLIESATEVSQPILVAHPTNQVAPKNYS